MSSIKQPRNAPSADTEAVLLGVFLAVVAVVGGGIYGTAHLSALVDDRPAPSANPFTVVIGTFSGDVPWTGSSTALAVLLGVVVLLLAVAIATVVLRRRGARGRVDLAASRMGRGRAIAPLTRKSTSGAAKRLGVDAGPGLLIGRSVATGAALYQDWEAVSVDIAGPRTGKTTSRVIPAILAAPGAVVTTSNKRDVVDATRGVRAREGRVWVFDPQGLVDEPLTWWWNPLSYVTDETKAQALAEIFATASRKADARTDAYFDSAALELLGNLLLAAALDSRPITDVYVWITDPNDDTAAEILDRHDYPLPAASVRGVVGSPDKQRAGVYGTAQQVASFLTNRQATRWVTPAGGGLHFSPEAFVATTDTLYSLSKEGRGNAGPLVTALTVAVCEAAEEHAKRQPSGRLQVPMVVVLDEAANVCRWSELPNLYSHYGSRGVNMLTFLQSWSQGVEAWGREGMRKLWSASNVKVYGGGVSEVEFLSELAQLIGDYSHVESSTSYQRTSGRSVSRQHRTDKILDVADLAALDRGRMVVLASGAVPVLARSQPWYEGPDREAVQASINTYAPGTAQ